MQEAEIEKVWLPPKEILKELEFQFKPSRMTATCGAASLTAKKGNPFFTSGLMYTTICNQRKSIRRDIKP